MAENSSDELEDLIALHYAVERLLRKRFKGPIGGYRGYQVLVYLQTRKAAKPKDLAKALRASESTVTHLVDKLAQSGLVERDSNTDWVDSRNRWVHITDDGLRVLSDGVDVRDQICDGIFRAVGGGDRAFRARILALIEAFNVMTRA